MKILSKETLLSAASLAVILSVGSGCSPDSESKGAKKEEKKQENHEKQEPKNHSDEKKPLADASSDDEKVATNKTPEDEQQEMLKVSEAFGNFIGRNLNTPGIKFDLESIIKGMREGVAGKPSPMSDQDYEEAMTRLQLKAFKQVADDNLKTANDFLAKNAKEQNIKELVPGKLQYAILSEGNGAVVEEHFAPSIQYSGKFADGSVFGSSADAGGPLTVPLDQTIPGFSKGLVGMKEGEKRRLFVHPDLGYGTSGQLPPNSLLIFDVEVIKANASPENDAEHKKTLSDSADDDSSEFEILELNQE